MNTRASSNLGHRTQVSKCALKVHAERALESHSKPKKTHIQPANQSPSNMSDPRESGDLSDMAVKGTTVPKDAATQRTIPSVPNPHQQPPYQSAGADLAGGADNATDIPRSTGDRVGATAEVVTGTRVPSSGMEAELTSYHSVRRQHAGRDRNQENADADGRHGQRQGVWTVRKAHQAKPSMPASAQVVSTRILTETEQRGQSCRRGPSRGGCAWGRKSGARDIAEQA